MIDTKLNGRRVYLPQGRSSLEDLCILADCIAASSADLFEEEGTIIWIAGGKKLRVTPEVLKEIIAACVVTKHPRQTAEGWNVEYRSYEADTPTLHAMILAKTREDGGLIQRLPKAVTPHALSQRHRLEALDRLRVGEEAGRIAKDFGTDVSVIQRLVSR